MPRFTTLIRSKSLRVAGAVAALAVTAPFATPTATAADPIEGIHELSCKSDQVFKTSRAHWQKFAAPKFEPGIGIGTVSQEIKSYAVGAHDSRTVAVTNGNSVYVSRNGGCTFTLGMRLDRVPDPALGLQSGALTTIKQVFVSPAGTFFALAEELENGPGVGRPHVFRSTDPRGGNGTWEAADSGLPPIGRPLTIKSNKDGRVLYVTFAGARAEGEGCPPAPLPCNSQPGQRLGLMYASTDGGQTWQSRTNPNELDSIAEIKYVSVDDDDPNGNLVWVVANGTLQKSTNGGSDFAPPSGLDQSGFEFTAVESLRRGIESQGVELVAFSKNSEMIRLTTNRGWIRSRLPFPAAVEAVAQRPEGDLAVVTGAGFGAAQLWRIYPRDFLDYEDGSGLEVLKTTYGWELLTPGTGAMAVAVGAGATPGQGAGSYYVREGSRLLRFLGSAIYEGDPPAKGVDLVPPKAPKGKISPKKLNVDFEPDETRTVDYTLTLPPSPTPLDVYLLVDNSGSMSTFINDLKENLRLVVNALFKTGVDVGIGVGQINVQPDSQQLPIDNPRTPRDESKPLPMYQRLRPVGPINPQLFDALSKLDGNSGSGSEPQLEALWQTVEPEGLSFEGTGALLGYSILPGQGAGFRDELDPIKVIVHATDENFTGTDTKGPPREPDNESIRGGHNSIAPVAAKLREKGVMQIGLSMDQDDSTEDLRAMARATNALAPDPIDCDGDGRIGFADVRRGEPMVCGQSTGLDKTLVNLLQSLKDPASITLSKDASPALVRVSQETFFIDAKRRTNVSFKVTYSCAGLEPGRYDNTFTAKLRGREIAQATAAIKCGGVDVPPPPGRPAPPQIPVEPGGNPPPPQPQPIAPAPVPLNPVPQPQTQPQVQSQVNPQGGLADQEEEQLQLAAAENDITREQDELAMVGLSYETATGVVLALGMTMTAAAGAVAYRRRSRTATAKVTVRR